MQLKKYIFFILITFFIVSLSWAGVVKQQGLGHVNYDGWGDPSTDVKREAVEKAKKSAIEKYTSGFSTAKLINYEKIRSSVEGNLDRFITEYRVVDDDIDKNSKTYRVVVDAQINASLIEVELQKISAVNNVTEDEKSYLSFVFAAREVTSKSSLERRNTEAVNARLKIKEEEEFYVEDKIENSYSAEVVEVKSTSNYSEMMSDELVYDASNSEDINAAISGVFSLSGYEVVDAVYLQDETNGLVNVDDFMADFSFGDDISGATLRNAAKGCKSVGIDYLAIGTLDVGMKDIDPVSGLTRVYVSVNGKIVDLSKRFPKTVASVGPVQYAGLGPNQTVARRNALRLAGESAANNLISKLQAKDIR